MQESRTSLGAGLFAEVLNNQELLDAVSQS